MQTGVSWDTRLFLRSFVFAASASVLAALVGAATDEGGVAWSERASRVAPVVPVCCALAAYVSLSAAVARGELVALAAVGIRPGRAVLAAAAGATMFAAVTAGGIFAGVLSASAFYPVVPKASVFIYDGARFVDASRGIAVEMSGAMSDLERTADMAASEAGLPRGARWVSALSTLVLGAGFSLAFARTLVRDAPRMILVTSFLGALALGAFQSAAVQSVPGWSPLLVAVVVLVAGAARYAAVDGRFVSARDG
jgi:hypothetical protein